MRKAAEQYVRWAGPRLTHEHRGLLHTGVVSILCAVIPPSHMITATLVALLAGVVSIDGAEPQAERFFVESSAILEVGEMPISSPKWSPDGKWIAFSAAKGNGIGLVRPDGSERRTLTSESGSGYKFAWSPDGSQIVFRAAQREKGPRQYAFRVVEVASGEIESSTETIKDAQPPMWQRGPRGMRWTSHAPSGAIESEWREGGAVSIRAAEVGPPALIQRARGFWLRGATTAQQRKVSGEIGLNPVWNGDGTRVAFDAQDTIAIASPSQPGTPRTLCAGQHPAWSPDGKWIVFQITRDHSHAPDDARQHTPDTMPHRHDDKTNHRIVDSDLWIIGVDGTDRHQLTATPDVLEVDPDWSPDGSAIVCGTEEAGRLLVLKIGRR